MKIQFTVWGEPVGKGRPRFSGRNGFTSTYSPKTTVEYENLVKTAYKTQCGNAKFVENVMLDMRVYAYLSIPKSASKKKKEQMRIHKLRPTKRPDMDNILKIIADGLNKLAYHDDAQIVDAMVRKFYSDRPRVEITIQSIEGSGGH